jgi:hypothetical protein
VQSIFRTAKRSEENPNRHYSQDEVISNAFSAVNEMKPPSSLDLPVSLLSCIWDVTDFKSRLGHPVIGLMFFWLSGSAQVIGGILP